MSRVQLKMRDDRSKCTQYASVREMETTMCIMSGKVILILQCWWAKFKYSIYIIC